MPMRRFVAVFSAVATVFVCLGADRATGLAQGRTADSVMAAARAALGGDAKIAAVKTFIATGRTRQVRGENLVPIEFEIQAELPDKYSRRDEFPAQDAGPVTAGFVGDALVLIPRPAPPPPRPGMPAPPPRRDGSAAARAHDASEAGLRAADARHVRGDDGGVPRHLCVCRTSRSAARQGRRRSTSRDPQTSPRDCSSPTTDCRSW